MKREQIQTFTTSEGPFTGTWHGSTRCSLSFHDRMFSIPKASRSTTFISAQDVNLRSTCKVRLRSWLGQAAALFLDQIALELTGMSIDLWNNPPLPKLKLLFSALTISWLSYKHATAAVNKLRTLPFSEFFAQCPGNESLTRWNPWLEPLFFEKLYAGSRGGGNVRARRDSCDKCCWNAINKVT